MMQSLLLLLLLLVPHRTADAATILQLDPAAPSLVFDGHGGLSAGASSRLLIDYIEPARSQILDYLYKPKFGASLQVCKVEIGGDAQSTDGTEPSHMHTRNDLDCTRGYEWWLMKEAKARNPAVKLYGLPWGMPNWVNNQHGYFNGSDSIDYLLQWLRCAREAHGLEIDWLSLWNERTWGTSEFVLALRDAMDSADFRATKLLLIDGPQKYVDSLAKAMADDERLAAAFEAVGIHYPNNTTAASELHTRYGKKVWSSEDWWKKSGAEWPGAAKWASELNGNFLASNMTSTIAWSTIWSVYPVVDSYEGSGDSISGDSYWGPGLMYAWQPWSGHYAVPPTVWASAHTTQFTQPGWRMLLPQDSGGGSSYLAGGGSAVTYVSSDRPDADISIVVETGAASSPQTLVLALLATEVAPRIFTQWRSNETEQFVRLADVNISKDDESVSLELAPMSIYTFSTTSGQRRGWSGSPPPSAKFPGEYKTNFSESQGNLARYWADQAGSFELAVADATRSGGKLGLRQSAPAPPGCNGWGDELPQPTTILGDPTDSGDREVFAVARIPASAAVETPQRNGSLLLHGPFVGVCGRVSRAAKDGGFAAVCLQANRSHWQIHESVSLRRNNPNTTDELLALGSLPSSSDLDEAHELGIRFVGSKVDAWFDGHSLLNGNLVKVKASAGMQALQTGWHEAWFDSFETRSLNNVSFGLGGTRALR